QGVISLHSAMYIILGFNIGTCVTSVLSSVGSSKNARRTALVHVLFNIIGTIIFVCASFVIPIDKIVIRFSRNLPAAEIANLHTLFNIVTTILLIPFSKKLADLAFKIIPGIDKEQEEMSLKYINLNVVKDAPATFTDVKAEVRRLLDVVTMNYEHSVELLKEFDEEKYEEVFRREKVINYLNKQISAFIIDSLGLSMNEQTSANFANYLRISRDMERIGDHSKNIAEVAKLKNDEGLLFTDVTFDELREINAIIDKMFHSYDGDMEKDERVLFMRQSNELVQKEASAFRNNHMIRMREKICNPESGLLYEKTLAAMERISSYISNAGKLSI
ncbi:MAG: Na/Pi cotransporter family protein, partial [Peptoniphilus sp.]